jgi:hypothetical protein
VAVRRGDRRRSCDEKSVGSLQAEAGADQRAQGAFLCRLEREKHVRLILQPRHSEGSRTSGLRSMLRDGLGAGGGMSSSRSCALATPCQHLRHLSWPAAPPLGPAGAHADHEVWRCGRARPEGPVGLVAIPVTGAPLQLAPGRAPGRPMGAARAAAQPAMGGTRRIGTAVRGGVTVRRRPRGQVIRGGGAPGAVRRVSAPCAQAAHRGVWMHPVQGVGAVARGRRGWSAWQGRCGVALASAGHQPGVRRQINSRAPSRRWDNRRCGAMRTSPRTVMQGDDGTAGTRSRLIR